MFKLKKKSTGEWKTIREFLSEVKEGMEKVTPLQQTIVTLWGIFISIIGIVWGIIFSIGIGYKWMALILVGGLIVAIFQFLGNWQRKQVLDRMEAAYQMADLIAKKEVQ